MNSFIFESNSHALHTDADIASLYFKSLENALKSWNVTFTNCYFSTSSFNNFMKSSNNAKRVYLNQCRLIFDSNLNISGPNYDIRYIEFNCCYGDKGKTMKANVFEKIALAISESSLKDSLSSINIIHPEKHKIKKDMTTILTKDEAIQIMKTHGLGKVSIYLYNSW